MTTTVYLNLEDDVTKIVARIKKVRGNEIILVCPKRCYLFSDKVNLSLLKKQADFLKKKISILTMDEKGQNFAQEVGFEIKLFPKRQFQPMGVSDIQIHKVHFTQSGLLPTTHNQLTKAVKDVSNFVTGLVMKKDNEEVEKKHLPTDSNISKAPSPILNPVKVSAGVADRATIHKKSHIRILSLVGLLTIILSLFLFFVVLPEAKVTIYPKSEKLIRDFDIALDSSAKKPDVASLILPSTRVEETLTQTEKFQSKGKKDVGNKASGYVKIYNFTGQILNLKTETTTLNVSGKSYKLVNDALQIKPIKYKNPKTKEIDESSLSEPFAVIATAGGETYNLPSGLRMEISNTVFGSRPQVLYAKTDDPITGGYTRYLSIISEEDITIAREALGSKILTELKQKLTDSGLELLEGGYRVEILDFSTDKPVNTESPSFNAKLAVKLSGIAFAKNDFNTLVRERLQQGISDNKDLDLENNTTITKQLKNIDLNLFNASLVVHLETKAFTKIDTKEFLEKLQGQNSNKANEFLLSNDNILKAEITLLPAWQKTFPFVKKRITITISK